MRKALKITLYTLGGIFILLLISIVWLNTTPGKNFVRGRIVAFLSNKVKTEIHIGELGYGLPKYIDLKNVLFKDQANDTLLAVEHLRVNISMLKLMSNQVDVQSLTLEGVHSHIYRNAPDTNFNFTYIINAFAGKTPKEGKTGTIEDTSGTKLSIDVNKIELNDIHARFDDYTGGTRLAVNLDHLILRMKKIDLEEMDFRVKELTVKGLASTFLQDASLLPEKPDTSTEKTNLKLSADDIDLQDVVFKYGDNVRQFLMDIKLGKLKTQAKSFDMAKEFIDIDQFDVERTTVKILMGKRSTLPEKVDSLIDTLAQSNWRVIANQINLDQINFIMDDENMPRQAHGIDYGHLELRNLALNSENIFYTADSIRGDIQHLAVQEKSGLDLKELKTQFVYHTQGGYLRDLYLETSNTILQDYVEVKYPSLDALKTRMDLIQFKLNLENSVVGLSDVLIFVPAMQNHELFRKYKHKQLQLEASMDGYVNAININNFYLAGLNNTKIHLTGKVNGLPETNKLNYNLNILQLQSSNADITALVPRQALEQIRVPNTFSARGQVSGTLQDYRMNLAVMSSDGAAVVKGYVYMSPGKGNERYDMFVDTKNLNLGRILKKDSIMGAFTATVTAKGYSFDIKRMEAMAKGDIKSAGFMGYNYNSINFEGEITKSSGNLDLVSNDPNLKLQLNAKADLTGKDPKLLARINIDSADLQALKLYKDEMRIRALILADIDKLNADYPSGIVIIDKPTITTKGQRYFMDTLKITSNPNADSGQYIVIEANALEGLITGKTPLSQVGNIIASHINRHYAFNGDSTKPISKPAINTAKIPADYSLNLQATIKDRPLLYALIPSLKAIDTVKINAGLRPSSMFLNVDAPYVVVDGITIDSATIRVNENDSALTYVAAINKITHPDFQFWYTNAHGTIKGNSITADVRIADSAKKDRFAINGVYHQHHDRQEFHINDGLKLNYKDWQVSQPNAVVIGKDGVYVQNFKISNGGESISINSQAPQFSAPMTIAINDFLISNITEIVQKDTLLANGVLNSNITVRNIMTAPAADGNLQIQNLSIKNDTIGNLNVVLNEASANKAAANITLNGRGNDIVISGSYYPQPVNGNNFDLQVDVKALDLKSMEGLAMNQLKNSSGFIRGNLHIKGTTSAPVITGELRTDNLTTTPVAIGSPFKMPAEKIRFTAEGIEFDNFKLVDSFGNYATLSGRLITRDLKNIGLDLRIRANKWQALNSTAKDNELFYGKLVLSTNLTVKGTTNAPSIDGNLTIHDTTKLTVVMPENNPGMQEREGVIEFVDMDDPNRYNLLTPKDTTPKMTMRVGTDMNLNVAIEKNAEFNMIIDKATGDFIRVRGEASLNTAVNPDGTIGLTGVYELNQGSYQLNYNFVKRRFEIQKGSTITFAGDPLLANLNVTAVYLANVPPYDLVERQVDDVTTLNYYKQRLPFDVQLKLKGELLEPQISFDILLPEERNYRVSPEVLTMVQGRLTELRNNPSELNKQVFAVLVLNRFVSENPFESGTGTDAKYFARQSASRFLSEQFNKMANNMIGGFELNVDLESTEDYTTGQKRNRTDLNVSASKRLLDDRLTVTVGNNFELEGQSQNTNENTSLVPGNLAADYQLSPDGRYLVRIYRQNEIENILEGYAVETGVSFIATLEYNRFKNLFINRKRNRQIEKGRNEKNSGTSN